MNKRFEEESEPTVPKHDISPRNKALAIGIGVIVMAGAVWFDSKGEAPYIKAPVQAKDLGSVSVGKEQGRGFLMQSEDQDAIVCERDQKPDGIIDLRNGEVVAICGNADETTPVKPGE